MTVGLAHRVVVLPSRSETTMLTKKNTDSDTSGPHESRSSSGAKRWPVAFVALGVVLTLIWVGCLIWLVLRFLYLG